MIREERYILQKGITRRGFSYYLESWILQHLQAFFFSLGQFCRNPLASLLTASVIGIALALPAGFYVLLENAIRITSGWESTVEITAFLKNSVGDQRAQDLVQELQQNGDIAEVRFISKEEALEEYRRLSGFAEALDAVETNPLPSLLLVKPALKEQPRADVEALLQSIQQLPEVENAQYDQLWIKRLNAIISIVQRAVWILAVFLALAVLLIIGNTIRMLIFNRRSEIEIAKLFGATDGFIQRPFLYSGFWYGLTGSLIAWILISVSLWLLHDPARQLAQLYSSGFTLAGLGLKDTGIMFLAGIGLGWLGSLISVRRHLRAIEPA